jgi:hypothetical protein
MPREGGGHKNQTLRDMQTGSAGRGLPRPEDPDRFVWVCYYHECNSLLWLSFINDIRNEVYFN